MRAAFETYQRDTSEDNRIGFEQSKHQLGTKYNTVTEEDLSIKIQEVEQAHINCQHGRSWSLINEISGRKSSMKGQIKGDNKQERIENWYNHFRGLLGNPSEVTDEFSEY